MRELEMEQRLSRMEESLSIIRRMLEQLVKHPQGNVTEQNEIMSVKQLVHFLGLDATIIYAKCSKGEIPYFKLGKQYRFKRNEIENWLKEQKNATEVNVDDYVSTYLQKNVMKS